MGISGGSRISRGRQPIILAISPKNCMKLKKLHREGCPSLAPPPPPPAFGQPMVGEVIRVLYQSRAILVASRISTKEQLIGAWNHYRCRYILLKLTLQRTRCHCLLTRISRCPWKWKQDLLVLFISLILPFEFFHINLLIILLNLMTKKNCSQKDSIQGSLHLKTSVWPSVIAIIFKWSLVYTSLLL